MQALRRRRLWLPLLVVVTLLFAQLATAAYACPRLAADAGEPAVAMADMPDCSEHGAAADPEQPALCKAHCQAGQQSVERDSRTPDVPPAMPAALFAVVDLVAPAPAATLRPAPAVAGPSADPLPLYLRLLVLRN